MKKNVYIFTLKSPDSGGGVEKVSKELGYGLYNSGKFNVKFIFSGNENKTDIKNGINYITIKNKIKVPLLNEVFFSLKLIKFLFKLNEDDIVVDNQFTPIFYLLFYSKQFKLIHISHGAPQGTKLIKYWGVSFIKTRLNILYSLSLNILNGYVIRRSDLIITLSKYLKKGICEYYNIHEDKIIIIYNGCDINNKKFKNHNKNNLINVIFVGSNYGGKGLNILEGVAKKLLGENISFKVIGTNSYKSHLPNIKSLGRLEREILYKHMENSDVIFLPSYYEGQPLVLFEAMSFGCIPVFSKECHMDMLECTQLNDFLSEKNLIEDYVSIFKKILKLGNIDWYRKYSKEFISSYNWDNQIQKYIDIFSKI